MKRQYEVCEKIFRANADEDVEADIEVLGYFDTYREAFDFMTEKKKISPLRSVCMYIAGTDVEVDTETDGCEHCGQPLDGTDMKCVNMGCSAKILAAEYREDR